MIQMSQKRVNMFQIVTKRDKFLEIMVKIWWQNITEKEQEHFSRSKM